MAADQQAAAGLRVAQQGALPFGGGAGPLHCAAIGRPVTRRSTGRHALAGKFDRAGNQRHLRQGDVGRQVRSTAHLQQVAGQAKAGDVGHGAHAVQLRQRNANAVQLRGVAQHFGVALGAEHAFFQRR